MLLHVLLTPVIRPVACSLTTFVACFQTSVPFITPCLPIRRHSYTPYTASKQWEDNITFLDDTFCIACGDLSTYGNLHPFCAFCMLLGAPEQPLCCFGDQHLCQYGRRMTGRALSDYFANVRVLLDRWAAGQSRRLVPMRAVSVSTYVPLPLPVEPRRVTSPAHAPDQPPVLSPVLPPVLSPVASVHRRSSRQPRKPLPLIDDPVFNLSSRSQRRTQSANCDDVTMPTMVRPRRFKHLEQLHNVTSTREPANRPENEASLPDISYRSRRNNTHDSAIISQKTATVTAPVPEAIIKLEASSPTRSSSSATTTSSAKTKAAPRLFPREELDSRLTHQQSDHLQNALHVIHRHPHPSVQLTSLSSNHSSSDLTPRLTIAPDKETYTGVNQQLDQLQNDLLQHRPATVLPDSSRNQLDRRFCDFEDQSLVPQALKLPSNLTSPNPLVHVTHQDLSYIDQALSFSNAALHTAKELLKYQVNVDQVTSTAATALDKARESLDTSITAQQIARAHELAITRRNLIDQRQPIEQQYKLMCQHVTDSTKILQ